MTNLFRLLSLLGLLAAGCTSSCSSSATASNAPSSDAAPADQQMVIEADASSDAVKPDVAPPPPRGECEVGETRHCYSGPAGTEGVGQCHGAEQACYRGVDGQGHWPGLIDCVTEITPHPVEVPYDGIDNDCNGFVDDDARLFMGRPHYCDRELGCFWFGSEPDYWGRASYGEHTCYTSGRFRRLTGPVAPGMFIAIVQDAHAYAMYYIGLNGRRYYIPNANVFASWFINRSSTEPFNTDARGCATVLQVEPSHVAAIVIGGNVTLRPGTVATGITTDPRRYMVSRGGVLRALANEGLLLEVQAPWMNPRVVMTADAFFVNYVVGVEIENPSTYNWMWELGVTLDQNLGLAP